MVDDTLDAAALRRRGYFDADGGTAAGGRRPRRQYRRQLHHFCADVLRALVPAVRRPSGRGGRMRQVLQELDSGKTLLADVPEPAAVPGTLRIVTRRSLISAGTERMLVEFARAGWMERARQQPERVRQALDKARTDGVAATVDGRAQPSGAGMPLGYCNVGEVDDAAGTAGFAPGDRVVCNGPHAEVVAVPVNLCARIPADVSDDTADVRRYRRHRPAGHTARGPFARRVVRGHRARADRSHDRAAAARQRLPRAWHRSRPGAHRAGAALRRRHRRTQSRRGPGRRRAALHARPAARMAC